MEIILQSWSWYVVGSLITLVIFLLFYFRKFIGVPSNLEAMCAMGGTGKFIEVFNFNTQPRTNLLENYKWF